MEKAKKTLNIIHHGFAQLADGNIIRLSDDKLSMDVTLKSYYLAPILDENLFENAVLTAFSLQRHVLSAGFKNKDFFIGNIILNSTRDLTLFVMSLDVQLEPIYYKLSLLQKRIINETNTGIIMELPSELFARMELVHIGKRLFTIKFTFKESSSGELIVVFFVTFGFIDQFNRELIKIPQDPKTFIVDSYKPKIYNLENFEERHDFLLRKDLIPTEKYVDHNNHINVNFYLSEIVNSMKSINHPATQKDLRQLSVLFRKETQSGEQLKLSMWKDGAKWVGKITRDNEIVVAAELFVIHEDVAKL